MTTAHAQASTLAHDGRSSRAMGWLSTPCRLILGGLFITAGFLKLQDPQLFVFAVKGFKILPEHMVIVTAFVVPWTEIIAGALLVLGIWARGAALVISGMLLVFIAGVASVIARPAMDVKCSCFGKFEWPCIGKVGWCQIVRNLGMLALALPVLIWGPGALAIEKERTR